MSLTERAVEVVRTLAAELGFDSRPVPIADRSHLVLRLEPHRLVARVAMATGLSRVGLAWLRREVAVARFLHERGVPVTRPSASPAPGPFERDGWYISFWELEALTDAPPDPGMAARAFAAAHRALRGFPREALPEWGAWQEACAVRERATTNGLLSSDEASRLHRAFERAAHIVESAGGRTASMQAVHGDAHFGNVMSTARGPVWTDWEDAFVGPVEFDLACLRSRFELFGEEGPAIAAFEAAYDVPHDPELVRELGLVRNVQVVAWLAVFAERQPELAGRLRARLQKLPR